jgi:hypothetical protein
MAAEQEQILKDAAEVESKIEAKTEEYEEAKEEAKEEMEKLGISVKATRRSTTSVGTAMSRAKNNFQYRLKQKGWIIDYNIKNRIVGASNYGLYVEFDDADFIVRAGDKDGDELLKHPYGAGSLTELAKAVEEHGEDVEE